MYLSTFCYWRPYVLQEVEKIYWGLPGLYFFNGHFNNDHSLLTHDCTSILSPYLSLSCVVCKSVHKSTCVWFMRANSFCVCVRVEVSERVGGWGEKIAATRTAPCIATSEQEQTRYASVIIKWPPHITPHIVSFFVLSLSRIEAGKQVGISEKSGHIPCFPR